MKAVTLKDIAQALNVSVVTVSKALANKEGVSEITRKKIKEKAQEIGYAPLCETNPDVVPRKIHILLYKNYILTQNGQPHIDYFYGHIYNRLSLYLSERFCSHVTYPLTEEMENTDALPVVAQGGQPDGFIVLGQVSDSYLERLARLDIPVVLLDFYSRRVPFPYVAVNDFHNAYIITSHLIDMGHREIGFVGNPLDSSTTTSIRDRYWGMRKALVENGLECRDEWILSDRTDRALTRAISFPENMPTALVCNCDQAAHETSEALQRLGLRVPEDISIVGFDDSVFSRMAKPQITTMALDVDAMVTQTVQCILRAIEQPGGEPESFVLQSKLICKESVQRRCSDETALGSR